MQASDVKWLQVENTSKCNAWCPSCGRNQNGYGLNPALVIEDLDIKRFEQVIDSFPNLEAIQFCGKFGDPAAASDPMQHFELAVSKVKNVAIHTNGSLRSPAWWAELAKLLQQVEHEVWFGLDGLKESHEQYRQGTSWDKIIENATAFINAGGQAQWQFIPFAHNEHEIKDCIKLSQELGFKGFKFVKNARYRKESYHWRTGKVIEIKPWSLNKDFNVRHAEIPKDQVLEKDCMHLSLPGVYLNANGLLNVCCFFNPSDSVEDFSQLADIRAEINSQPRRQCLLSCGSYATINNHDAN